MSEKGGRLLRQLREQAGQTQLWVELEAELGTGYLQRVESGKVKHPLRQTLERILDALHACYTERQQILELYGYTVSIPKPDESEIRWAIQVAQPELEAVLFPAYVLDCTHQLIAWNHQAQWLLTNSSQPSQMQVLNRISLIRIWFDTRYGIQPRVRNSDEFFAAMIRALYHETQLYAAESWYQTLLEQLLADLPLARTYWDNLLRHPLYPSAGRSIVPLHLQDTRGVTLQFRLSAERFTRDTRFRIIYFFPADISSMQQCTRWAAQN